MQCSQWRRPQAKKSNSFYYITGVSDLSSLFALSPWTLILLRTYRYTLLLISFTGSSCRLLTLIGLPHKTAAFLPSVWTSKRRKSHTPPSWFQPRSSPTFKSLSIAVPPPSLVSFLSSQQTLPIPPFPSCTLLSVLPIPPLLSEKRTVSRAIYLAECTVDSTHSHTSKMRYVPTNGVLGMGVMEDGVGWALLCPSDGIYKMWS